MAKVFPDIETILISSSYKISDESLSFIEFLQENLSDEFEIYYKPLINGDSPDIVIFKEDSGVIIISVFDRDIGDVYVEDNRWFVKNDFDLEIDIVSPLERSYNYKDNLYNLHIESLQNLLRENKLYWSIINCGAYFPHNKLAEVSPKIKVTQYDFVHGQDSLTNDSLKTYLNDHYFNRPSRFFNSKLAKSFKRYLQPPIHKLEEGKSIIYTKQQEKFIPSRKEQKRIHGVAGSGKTMVLARRAVNAHIRTKNRVLILTYNKTLRNFIRDRINDVRETFPWSAFTILHYHEFFKAAANNLGMKVKTIDAFSDIDYFERFKESIIPYEVVIVDEIQDYLTNWVRIVKKYFLIEDGEFVVFGDEKQDIYTRRAMDSIPIIGRPSRIDKSYRLTTKLAKIASAFQNYFFDGVYETDKIEIDEARQLSLINDEGVFKYYFLNSNLEHERIYTIVKDTLEELNIHPSDSAMLSSKTEIVASIDYFFRNEKNEQTTRIFEPLELRKSLQEEIEKHNSDNSGKVRNFSKEIDKIRDNLKRHFEMNSGLMKFSSIHSFKGWEIDTVFLIIENEDIGSIEFTSDELIYTGITRSKRNLIVINLGNEKYDHFFRK